MYDGVREGFDSPPWPALPVAAVTRTITVTVAGHIRSSSEPAAPRPGPDEVGHVGPPHRPDEARTTG